MRESQPSGHHRSGQHRDWLHGNEGRASTEGDQTLPEAFWCVARRLRQLSVESLARWDVTPAQARALRVLSQHGTMRLSELSEHLRIAARSATEVADGLQAKQLLRRLADLRDRRATLVELTALGVETGQAIEAARAAHAERLFARLTERERATLARIMRKLQD